MGQFDLPFLQAVNDWQRGGSHKQKVKRGATLKARSLLIDERFRRCATTCFRQEAHEKDRVWQLLADDALDETIAAWTVDLPSAMNLKGGVPPPGLQGVIFEIIPPPGSVVLNLVELYGDAEFLEAVARQKADIIAYGDGIGKYGASQHEVVLELGSLAQADIRHYGGYASSRRELAKIYFGRTPTEEDLNAFDQLCEQANVPLSGSWWLSPEGTKAVLSRIRPDIARLQSLKAAADRAAS
jgi:hypothetical protein